jgi:flagellar biosynthesis GTPase FlhF
MSVPEEGWEDLTLEEMRDVLEQIKEETGKNIRVIRPRASKTTPDRMLAGVETTENTSLEAAEARRRRGANT